MHTMGGECQVFVEEDKRKRELEAEKNEKKRREEKKREEEAKKKIEEREKQFKQHLDFDDDDWAVEDPSPKVQN